MIKSIAIDVDNVLADSIGSWCGKARRLGYNITKNEIKSHKIVGSVPIDPREVFRIQDEVWTDWQSVRPLEVSISNTVSKIMQMQIKVTVVTSGPLRHLPGIENWLRTWKIPFDQFRCLGPRKNKSLLRAEALVDDAPESIEAFVRTERTGFLYAQPWNATARIRNAIVVSSFLGVAEFLSRDHNLAKT
jgi:5'(3')-deoxyribonucleotidase